MTALRPVLDALPGADVLVVGDALLDEFLDGEGTGLCREAPVPVVTVDGRRSVPGGAGNVAANVAALGGRVSFLSVVGDDRAGRTLGTALRDAGVDVGDVLVEPGRATVAKRRVLAHGQLLVRFDEGRPVPLRPATERRVLDLLAERFGAADVVIVSDYGYGLLTDEVVRTLGAWQRAAPRLLVVDARQVARYRDLAATAVTPNYDEIRQLLAGAPPAGPERAAAVSAQADRLHDATGARIVAVTLDRDGSVVCERGRPPYRTWARPVPHSRACGAGDSFTSALALALRAAGDATVAAELAQAAAAVVTARDGTSVCSLDDLRAHLAETTTRLEPLDRLVEQVVHHRRQGRRIVFTNGCFDVLHRGHVDLLNRAKALGDVLVVGLNSDESMRRRGGPGRPINSLDDRASVLAALSAIDHLVAFDETTATELVTRLRPDVYVKGGDYTADMLPEAPQVEAHGGTVHILPYVEDRETVALIERIRRTGQDEPRPGEPAPAVEVAVDAALEAACEDA
ncbi:MAG: D-glycero-beta-D-manno-heptose 1-phosphate adenylyltransferase [Frankiaceae bacterium]